MRTDPPSVHSNIYQNQPVGATPNPLMPNPDAIDQAFAEGANQILSTAVELIRVLIGAHQAAAAVIVQHEWQSIRKYFSLSEKYAGWAEYRTPAVGYGIHGWLLRYNQPIRLTQAELEAHPEWKQFGTEAPHHPPMRGWLAAPIRGRDGTNWGLLQVSDKYVGEFTAEDEQQLVQFVTLVALGLEALWELRNERKAQRADTSP